jgi:hypothetical protein
VQTGKTMFQWSAVVAAWADLSRAAMRWGPRRSPLNRLHSFEEKVVQVGGKCVCTWLGAQET